MLSYIYLDLVMNFQQYWKVLINTTKSVGLIKSFLALYEGRDSHSGRMEENRSLNESTVSIFGWVQHEVLKNLQKGKDDN